MAIPPYLQDKKMNSRKRFPGRVLFNLIFILSLGLNIYLLNNPENPALNIASETWEVPSAEAKTTENFTETELDEPPAQEILARATPSPVTVGSMEPVLKPAPETGNINGQPHVTPVSYVVTQTGNPQGKAILRLNIRNSLTYTLCQAMTKEQGCQTMSAYLSRLLSWNFDINKSMRNGDSLDVVYEHVEGKDLFRILKMVYKSQLFNKVYEANYYSGDEEGWGAYFDAVGVEIAQSIEEKFAPLKKYQEITSLPGDFRKGPVGHKGTDFKTDIGTPVYATFEAKVLRTHWNVRVNGYCVELDHPREGVKTLYLHLSRVLVKPGQYVKQGEKIAETGNTGRTYAPHLHYEIKSRDDKKIVYNPFNLKHIKTYYKKVPLEERETFQKTVNLYDSILQKG